MARAALAALTTLVAAVAAASYDPCCVRVTPYHIQALAQRMAQRFQALEYRAQDLRYVFATFQQVHGNVTHRLRYLEAEHAHLSETVSRLDSRLQALEAERREAEYRQRVEFYRRGMRDIALRAPAGELLKSPARRPLVMRRRRELEAVELPHLFVHLDQPIEPSTDGGSTPYNQLPTPSEATAHAPPTSSVLIEKLATPAPAPETLRVDLNNVAPDPEQESSAPEKDSPPPSRVFVHQATEATSQMAHAAGDSATTPTPLWQLEETASALLNAMSAGDDDVGGADVPSNLVDSGVSYWSPANESDSLEELFHRSPQGDAPEPSKCSGQSALGCTGEAPGEQTASTDGGSFVESSTSTAILESQTTGLTGNSGVSENAEHDTFLPNYTTSLPGNMSNLTVSSEAGALNVSNFAVKTTGCKTPNSDPPVGEIPSPSDNMGNLTNILLDMGNATGPLLDIFSSGADGLVGQPSPPPGIDGGGSGDGGGAGAELSDAELQAALHELDALLQRPPASAPSPDPEKALLKRALTLALAALERTSDACLKLVNFTADAFEGMAAADV